MFSDTSGKNPRALSAQIGKSQLIAHSKPPPTAQPLMAPTTGFGPRTMASVARWIAWTRSRASASLSGCAWSLAVVAGAERPARAGEDDGPGLVVGVGMVEGAGHIVDQLAVHRVQALRPVERHGPHAVLVEVAAHGRLRRLARHGAQPSKTDRMTADADDRPTGADHRRAPRRPGDAVPDGCSCGSRRRPDASPRPGAASMRWLTAWPNSACTRPAGAGADAQRRRLRGHLARAVPGWARCRRWSTPRCEARRSRTRSNLSGGRDWSSPTTAWSPSLGPSSPTAPACAGWSSSERRRFAARPEAGRHVEVIDHASLEPDGHAADDPPPSRRPHTVTDPAMVLFTSGTTGPSKGCVLSHRYAVRQAQLMIEQPPAALGRRALLPVPDVPHRRDRHDRGAGAGCWGRPRPSAIASRRRASGPRCGGRGDGLRLHGRHADDAAQATAGADDTDHRVRLAWGVPVPEFARRVRSALRRPPGRGLRLDRRRRADLPTARRASPLGQLRARHPPVRHRRGRRRRPRGRGRRGRPARRAAQRAIAHLGRLLRPAGGHARLPAQPLVPHRRPRPAGRRGVRLLRRPDDRLHPAAGREHLRLRGRGGGQAAPARPRRRRLRRARAS